MRGLYDPEAIAMKTDLSFVLFCAFLVGKLKDRHVVSKTTFCDLHLDT